ncbi:hypothetical protein I5M27_11565 [Adhaeribacter sp. BT258]|uniref:Uncharacterized protein n=1 Tax=Adhaeribacter terrigena TaxID=2793070 RepID=A0ABS1C3B0_9BACT|nr:hypothetical protein [Adhaeribacter terrigena]MBK0403626.1 hypothetical protein [Adhaeribacter terrigena]
MKLLKKSILLSLGAPLLFSLLSFTNAIAGEGKVVTIRVYETCKLCGSWSPKIQVVEDGNSRIIALEKFEPKQPELSKNLETINTVLEEYIKKDYKISAFTSEAAATFMITTYILTK